MNPLNHVFFKINHVDVKMGETHRYDVDDCKLMWNVAFFSLLYIGTHIVGNLPLFLH
jgi:hypothetical protein